MGINSSSPELVHHLDILITEACPLGMKFIDKAILSKLIDPIPPRKDPQTPLAF